MELDKDFKEFVELLNAHKVEYLIVGGYSVAHHGYPRFTGDFDVWVKPDLINGKKMMSVLNDFGFGAMGITAGDFTSPDKVIQFGVEPVRIDILTAVDGIPDFDRAFKQRDISQTGGITINFISYNDLIANKKATNRLQDKLDVEQLSKVNKKHPENLQQYQPGDKVKDIWGKFWTILKRHDDRTPIKYDVEEEKDGPLNQIDIVHKI